MQFARTWSVLPIRIRCPTSQKRYIFPHNKLLKTNTNTVLLKACQNTALARTLASQRLLASTNTTFICVNQVNQDGTPFRLPRPDPWGQKCYYLKITAVSHRTEQDINLINIFVEPHTCTFYTCTEPQCLEFAVQCLDQLQRHLAADFVALKRRSNGAFINLQTVIIKH